MVRVGPLEARARLEAFLEAVVRHLEVQMMDVVEADVAAEPLEDAGEVEVRTAGEGGLLHRPRIVAIPVGVLELVLRRSHIPATEMRTMGRWTRLRLWPSRAVSPPNRPSYAKLLRRTLFHSFR
jgi:hypothetical protein